MKRIFLAVVVVLLVWILGIGGTVGTLYFSVVNFSPEKLPLIQTSQKILSILLYPLQRFPYVAEVYSTNNSTYKLTTTAVQVLPVIQKHKPFATEISATDLETLTKAWKTARNESKTLISLANSNRGRQLANWLHQTGRVNRLLNTYQQAEADLPLADDIVDKLPYLIGMDAPRHYLVLFQNNMELRPTGGFMGSYGEVWIDKGKLTLQIQDIYVPDGQIKGYVPEPSPIKKYLFNDNHPGWRLRDANWHPDFVKSTEAISWFMNEGGLKPFDGYMAINLFLISDILQVSGPVHLPDYQLTVGADNFYQEAQKHAEIDFFPGSTQKGDFLRSVGLGLLIHLEKHPQTFGQLIPVFLKQLNEKHLMAYIPAFESGLWKERGYDGSLLGSSSDYLSINEANVGITKANCCVVRDLSDNILIASDSAKHSVKINYVNNNPPKPEPPHQWGGGYKDYLRVILPKNVIVTSIKLDGKLIPKTKVDMEEFDSHSAAGFLVLTEGGMSSVVELEYTIPLTDSTRPYQLFFQKQSGIEAWPVKISITDGATTKFFEELVRTDRVMSLD